MAILGAVLVCLALLVVVKIVRQPASPFSSFDSFWLVGLSVLAGLAGCVFICEGLAIAAASSIIPLVIVFTVNVFVQPFLILGILNSIKKIVHGIGGQVYFGSKVVPADEFPTPKERRELAWYCAAQGVVGLLVFGWVSFGCIRPLL